MNNNRWFKVSAQKDDGSTSFLSYQLAGSPEDARAAAGWYWSSTGAEGVPGSEVPAELRVMKEASTEQLKNELKARGWSVTLSCT
jgi:hypothetical protein